MALNAIRGGVGFLTQIPLGHDEQALDAFRNTPSVFPLVGYLLGSMLILPFLLPLPAETTALVFVVWIYVITGINHIDGVADLGDAVVVHGDQERRRAVMTDTTIGVGAMVALVLTLVGFAFAGLALARVPMRFLAIVIAAEVGAKFGLAMVACLGTASHSGLGSSFTTMLGKRELLVPAIISSPAILLTFPHPAAAVAFLGAIGTAVAVLVWARSRVGGVSGDVFGAINEWGRLVALHSGVILWIFW